MDRKPESRSPRRQIFTALLATIPTFTYGIQIGWLSPMGPLLKSSDTPAQVPLTDSDISWMAAALPLAAICGIPFFSYASDRFGRKKGVIAVSLLSCISWTVKLSSITAPSLIIARVIAGLASGGCFVVVPVYVKEISEDSWRGALGSLTMTVCKLGVIFVYATGMAASYKVNQIVYLTIAGIHVVVFCFMPESPNYLLKIGKDKLGVIFVYATGMAASYKVNQIVYLTIAGIHVVVFCFMPESPNYLLKIGKDKLGVIFVYATGMAASYKVNQIVYLTIAGIHVVVFCFMPESPNYLLKIGKDKRAVKTISWLRCTTRSSEVVMDEIARLKNEQRRFLQMPKTNIFSVVHDRPAFAALRMTLVLMAMQTLSGCFALMNYAADVFHRAGTEWSPNTLALFVGSLQLAGSFFTTMSIEKFGRKKPLAYSSLVVSICMATLATCFLVGSGSVSWLPVVAVCLCILAYGAGLAPVPMVIMAEVFTFQLRARMAGASMAFSFFCSSMTVLFYTPVANQFGPYVVFYTFSAVAILGVIYTILCVPETRRKSLEEIQMFWKKSEPVFV